MTEVLSKNAPLPPLNDIESESDLNLYYKKALAALHPDRTYHYAPSTLEEEVARIAFMEQGDQYERCRKYL